MLPVHDHVLLVLLLELVFKLEVHELYCFFELADGLANFLHGRLLLLLVVSVVVIVFQAGTPGGRSPAAVSQHVPDAARLLATFLHGLDS